MFYNIIGFSRCSCGAITFTTDDGKHYSCHEDNLARFLPDLKMDELDEYPTTYMCDWCVNHHGLDLCACGSGLPFETCGGGFDCCGEPMQSLEHGYTSVRARDALGFAADGSIQDEALKTAGSDASVSSNYCSAAIRSAGDAIKMAMDLDRQAKALCQNLMSQVLEDIREAILPGVTPISTSPNCFIVSSSTMMKTKGLMMSAEYYSSVAQADLVNKALSPVLKRGMEYMLEKINEIVVKEAVVINRQTYPLNKNTVNVLVAVLESANQ